MKKKGFTLIELLAVIVILGIVALIATPMILGVIEKAGKGSNKMSAFGYIDAIENQIAINELDSSAVQIIDNVYSVGDLDVSLKGEKPSDDSWVKIEKRQVVNYSLKFKNYTVTKTGAELEIVKNGDIADKPETSIWTLPKGKTAVTLTSGDKICVSTECFYVISNDGTNIKALAEWNLLVGNQYDGSSTTVLSNPTGLQSETAKGWHYATGTTTVEYPSIGTIKFANSKYWDGTMDTLIDLKNSNNVIYPYLASYKVKLEEMDANISDISLITKKELISLGCNASTKSCSTVPSWVYQTTYWTGSAYDDDSIWAVGIRSIFDDYYANTHLRGVRPVITVLVSSI